MANYQDEYSRAFNGDEVADETKDAVVSDAAAEGEQESPDVAMVIDPAEAVAGGDQPAEGGEVATEEAQAEGEPVAEEQAEMASPEGDVDDGQVSPEDLQRQKSWEGRLRKREEELAAREAAVGNAPQEEVIDDGEISDIKQRLSDDFGDEFVGMISKLAAYEAQKLAAGTIDSAINPINETISKAISDVQEAFRNQHFSAIAEAHEDFSEIVASEEFGNFIETLPEADKANAIAVIDSGSPKQVIALLSQYKDSLAGEATATEDDLADALDAAGGVRGSAPVTLPSRAPVGDDDEYKSAWASM